MLKNILLWFICLLVVSPAKAQTPVPVTKFSTIQRLVDSNRFEMVYTIATTHHSFYLQHGTPYSDQNIRITRDSAFVIIQDSIAAGYLPYFGSGYFIPQTGMKGIVFYNKMFDQTKSVLGKGPRQSIAYRFTVTGQEDIYKISIDIRHNGQCYMFVNGLKRAPISYVGQIVEKVE